MPFTKENLMTLYSLSPEDVEQTLTAAKLPLDKSTYEDEEISSRFEVIRNYFNNEQVRDYTAAAELFNQHQASREPGIEQQPKNKRAAKGKKSGATDNEHLEPCDRLNVLELIALATKNCGVSVELLQAIQIMPLCGLLPNQPDFAPDECDRFLEACDLIKKQNKSYEEVAAYFGVSSDLEPDSTATEYLVEQVSERAVAAESNLSNLVDQVTDKRAANIPHLVNQSYLKNAVRHLAATQNQTETFFAGLEQRILERIEGKTRSRSFKALNWEPNPSLPSSVKPMSLPAESENGTNTD